MVPKYGRNEMFFVTKNELAASPPHLDPRKKKVVSGISPIFLLDTNFINKTEKTFSLQGCV